MYTREGKKKPERSEMENGNVVVSSEREVWNHDLLNYRSARKYIILTETNIQTDLYICTETPEMENDTALQPLSVSILQNPNLLFFLILKY